MEELKSDAKLAEFKKKVERTVCLDHLSPLVNESAIRSALGQFGSVKSIRFVPKYLGPLQSGKCALVEMKDIKQARDIITTVSKHHFMICGMPRPIIAHAAKIGMFEDCPKIPRQAPLCHWVERGHPDFKKARKLKLLTKTHRAEDAFLLKETFFHLK
uniref:RRM domain-containing protein n=1 Tax=Kalanchoe fedtschenkoi TaxID=63787 RepID=A0A7N0U527_KALFE